MTRKSKREIERAIKELHGEDEEETIDVVWTTPDLNGYMDGDGEPTDVDPDADTVIVINETEVMRRARAEEEGREILGPAEDAAADDAVRVAHSRG